MSNPIETNTPRSITFSVNKDNVNNQNENRQGIYTRQVTFPTPLDSPSISPTSSSPDFDTPTIPTTSVTTTDISSDSAPAQSPTTPDIPALHPKDIVPEAAQKKRTLHHLFNSETGKKCKVLSNKSRQKRMREKILLQLNPLLCVHRTRSVHKYATLIEAAALAAKQNQIEEVGAPPSPSLTGIAAEKEHNILPSVSPNTPPQTQQIRTMTKAVIKKTQKKQSEKRHNIIDDPVVNAFNTRTRSSQRLLDQQNHKRALIGMDVKDDGQNVIQNQDKFQFEFPQQICSEHNYHNHYSFAPNQGQISAPYFDPSQVDHSYDNSSIYPLHQYHTVSNHNGVHCHPHNNLHQQQYYTSPSPNAQTFSLMSSGSSSTPFNGPVHISNLLSNPLVCPSAVTSTNPIASNHQITGPNIVQHYHHHVSPHFNSISPPLSTPTPGQQFGQAINGTNQYGVNMVNNNCPGGGLPGFVTNQKPVPYQTNNTSHFGSPFSNSNTLSSLQTNISSTGVPVGYHDFGKSSQLLAIQMQNFVQSPAPNTMKPPSQAPNAPIQSQLAPQKRPFDIITQPQPQLNSLPRMTQPPLPLVSQLGSPLQTTYGSQHVQNQNPSPFLSTHSTFAMPYYHGHARDVGQLIQNDYSNHLYNGLQSNVNFGPAVQHTSNLSTSPNFAYNSQPVNNPGNHVQIIPPNSQTQLYQLNQQPLRLQGFSFGNGSLITPNVVGNFQHFGEPNTNLNVQNNYQNQNLPVDKTSTPIDLNKSLDGTSMAAIHPTPAPQQKQLSQFHPALSATQDNTLDWFSHSKK